MWHSFDQVDQRSRIQINEQMSVSPTVALELQPMINFLPARRTVAAGDLSGVDLCEYFGPVTLKRLFGKRLDGETHFHGWQIDGFVQLYRALVHQRTCRDLGFAHGLLWPIIVIV